MRALWSALALVGAGLVLAPRANAQVPVIDAANLAQNLRTATQAVIEVEQLKNQLEQLEETYQMFTNPTNVLGMATGMENQAIENPMPEVTALSGLLGGQTTPTGAGQTYFNQDHVYTATNGSAASTQLNANGAGIANIEGIASTNLSAIQARLEELPNLEADLNTATSITQVDAINGRIAAESQFVESQQAQAANLQVLATEQENSTQQQAQELHAEEAGTLAAEYKAAAGQ
jgi:hypothetical protein